MIDAETIRVWRINYGLNNRTPAEAMRWWSGEMHGCAPAGAIAALGLCIEEIERLRADAERYRWLRGREDGRYMTVYAFRTDVDEVCLGDELDAAIDAAMAAEQSERREG